MGVLAARMHLVIAAKDCPVLTEVARIGFRIRLAAHDVGENFCPRPRTAGDAERRPVCRTDALLCTQTWPYVADQCAGDSMIEGTGQAERRGRGYCFGGHL